MQVRFMTYQCCHQTCIISPERLSFIVNLLSLKLILTIANHLNTILCNQYPSQSAFMPSICLGTLD